MPFCDVAKKQCEMKGTNPECIQDWMRDKLDDLNKCKAMSCNYVGDKIPCLCDCPVFIAMQKMPSSGASNDFAKMKYHELHGGRV